MTRVALAAALLAVGPAGGSPARAADPDLIVMARAIIACKVVRPLLDLTAGTQNGTARDIRSYGTAFCEKVEAGDPPRTADDNSPTWLGEVAREAWVADRTNKAGTQCR